ncbi:iron chaperone [Kribbella sp. NPDC051620]|uniref:iron chaperone n=1 Tax=Kribbella sp. NPDC051620 TaxID=3364120 RepID=UPI0037903A52
MTTTKSTAKKTTTTAKSYDGFTKDERAAMKERARELKAASGKAEAEAVVLEKIAEIANPDERAIAERIHAIVKTSAPELEPKTWYGMPAYAKDGKIVCFFQPADKFKARYSTLGFNDPANLDDGDMWPTSFALTKLSPAVEKKVTALIKKAAS